MSGGAVDVTRHRTIRASAEDVWEWMCEPKSLDLFQVNPFHASAEGTDPELRIGSRVRVLHAFGVHREMRIARISILRPFEIAWSEVKADAKDWFPHNQRYHVSAQGDGTCILTNRLRGTFFLPGAKWWLVSWYRFVLPLVLDWENRRIAAANE